MPTRFWQVPHPGLTAHSAILTARRTVCHTAPLRNVVPLLASPRPDASYRKYSASVRPHLPVSSPFRIAATRKHSALHRVHQPLLPSAPLCSPLLPSAPRRGHLRDPAPHPKSPHKKKPHRAPGRSHCRPHAPLPRNRLLSPFAPSKTEAQRSEGRPTDTKKAPAHCAGAVSDAPRKAERRRENYFAIPFMIAPETPGAAWYSPNE